MPRFTNGDVTVDTDFPAERVQLLAEGFEEETAETLAARTVPELKDELVAAGLPTDGKKADLVDRLADGGDAKPAGKPAKS